SKVPGPLLAFNPNVGFDRDRAWGPTATFGISTNLFDLFRNLQSKPLRSRRTRLDLRVRGAKSIDKDFYNSETSLSFSRTFPGTVNHLAIDAGFSAKHEPLGENETFRNAVRIGGNLKMHTSYAPLEYV